MDFSLSKQEQLFLQMIREFAEKEVKPLAAEVDESERFPMETVQKMAKLGIMGIPFPVEYGGAGGNNILYTMAVEELSRVCATTGVIVSAHTSLCHEGRGNLHHFRYQENPEQARHGADQQNLRPCGRRLLDQPDLRSGRRRKAGQKVAAGGRHEGVGRPAVRGRPPDGHDGTGAERENPAACPGLCRKGIRRRI